MAEPATAEGPARRRTSWNLRAIVEEVAGRPIEDLQDPDRPPHPYLRGRTSPPLPASRTALSPEPAYDPVAHVYPPMVGAAGRAYHGSEYEHHQETLDRHAAPEGSRPTGPLARPERLYLHYLLLHMDRLSDTSLRYLQTVIQEEMDHRAPRKVSAAPSSPPVTENVV
ncbi:MAG TPA: hypothetical protein VK424_07830 [Thermoplasmata archaeon]|nr:hypothetical protein [Thermoplasmata archaeon]